MAHNFTLIPIDLDHLFAANYTTPIEINHDFLYFKAPLHKLIVTFIRRPLQTAFFFYQYNG